VKEGIMSDRPQPAFEKKVFTLPLTSIIPRRSLTAGLKNSQIYLQIKASVKEIGLIEPLVVFPHNDRGFLLLDGHLRLAILKELGATEAKSLLATDEDGYTYNKRVNYIPPVAQHLMLLQALNRGVSEERIAAALNVDVYAVWQKAKMLDGICEEVVDLLRDRKVSPELFSVLRKMKSAIQIATVELMILRNDLSVAFAKTRLALTPPDLLHVPATTKRKLKADSAAAQMQLEEDTEMLVRNLKTIETSYGTDILTLTVSCAYVEQLLACAKVVRYMERNHGGLLGTLQLLASETRARAQQKSAQP
jgi:ParB-like chromosome segregation protein Spo0J